MSKQAAASASGRRLIGVRVLKARIQGPARDVSFDGRLYRPHEEKEIEKERAKTEAPVSFTSLADGKDLLVDWRFQLGKTYNLDKEDGLPTLKIFAITRKKTMFSGPDKTPFGFIEVELDDVGAGVGPAWYDLEACDEKETTKAKVGQLQIECRFNRGWGEVAAAGAGETLLDVDGDEWQTDEEIAQSFMDKCAEGKKKKKGALVLKQDDAVDLACVALLKGRIKRADVVKRYESFYEKGKPVDQEDFLRFYKSVMPTAPNELQVVVVRAEKLRAADGASMLSLSGKGATSSDPYCVLTVGKQKDKTKVVKKDLNPFYNQKFSFSTKDVSAPLVVKIYDHDDIGSDKFLGRCTVQMRSVLARDKARREAGVVGAAEDDWYTLMNEKGGSDEVTRGRVQLILKWRHSTSDNFGPFTMPEPDDESTDEEDEGEDDAADGGEEPEADEVKKAKAKAKEGEEGKEGEAAPEDPKKALAKEQEGFKVVSGDYQVHVHIIECRDLKPKDLNGMSDPVVTVECFGQKQNTAVVKSTLSPVFDDLLIFNLKGLDKEEFEEGLIKISVKDSNPLFPNVLIGAYAFDATYVYYQKDHELYQSWTALINEKDEGDGNDGVQGYLKLSVQIVGPNDKLKIHRETDEKATMGKDKDIGSLVLMPPTIKKEKKWLIVTVYRADYLPMLDEALAGGALGQSGINAFYQVDFSDSKIKTKVKDAFGASRRQMNPEWNTELWIPVTVPTATNLVTHTVWDYDKIGDNDVAGRFKSTFKEVAKKKKVGPSWVNLYGAPTAKPSSLVGKLPIPGEMDWSDEYNSRPDIGSTYRGRVLVSQKVRDTLPKAEIKKDRPLNKTWKRKAKVLLPEKEPETARYVLKVDIISGTELPEIKGMGERTARKLGVWVSCGSFDKVGPRADNNKGCVEWNSVNNTMTMEQPRIDKHPEQFPDVFVYLYTGEDAKRIPLCFTRIKAQELFDEEFSGEFKWHTLQEDKALNQLPDKQFPGCVLLRLGLGTTVVAERTAEAWGRMTSPAALSSKVPYVIRVNIFQCRSLPALDANGMLDPYLKISVNGTTKPTTKKREVRDPMYFETFDFKTEINHSFGLQLAPRVVIKLFDSDDVFGLGGGMSDDYGGVTFLDLKDAFVDMSPHMNNYLMDGATLESLLPTDLPPTCKLLRSATKLEGKDLPDPKWVDFFYEKEGDGEGQLLASVQLIPSSPGHATEFPKTDIKPDHREAFLEITTLGCRNLIPYNFLPITLPRLEFVLALADETITLASPDSKKPSPQNPNFLRYDVLNVQKFPKKAIFAPRLLIKAFDTRLGGLAKPNIGNVSVPLENKVPWDPESYVAYESTFAVPSVKGPHVKGNEDGEEGEDEIDEDGGAVESKEEDPTVTEAKTVALAEPQASYKERLLEMAGGEDSGAGVFGALKHLEAERAKEDALLEQAFGLLDGPSDEEDEPDKPPAYMAGRQVLDGTLEEVLKTTPFETFHLELGQGSTKRSVGCFKGLIRVLEQEPKKEDAPFELESLLKPQSYKIRLYTLRGIGFTPMDPGWNGRPGKSDPYLKVDLGKETFNGRDDFVEDSVDVDFFNMIELNAELPGAGQLVIKVMDYDTFGTDDMIGRTVIDLEDRWFDDRWQKLGSDTKTDATPAEPGGMVRWAAKPLELREIHQPPNTSLAHGRLETWVDILLPSEATAFPPDDVSLPPIATFEVRVIIWKAKDVVSMDSLTNMNDTYVKAVIEGTEPKLTDIHWRAKKGKASWNWRMKFDVELGTRTRTMKFPYLKFSMWDKDILKWDDMIAETSINIGPELKRAYKKNQTVKMFDDAKKSKKKKAKPKQTPADDSALSKEFAIEEPAEAEKGTVSMKGAKGAPAADAGPAAAPAAARAAVGGESLFDEAGSSAGPSAEGQKEVELTPKAPSGATNPLHGGSGSAAAATSVRGAGGGKKANDAPTGKAKAPPAKKGGSFLCCASKARAEVDEDDEDAPLLDAEAQEKADDDKEASQAVSMVRGLLGLGEDDPPDSHWLDMNITDPKTKTAVPMGKVCISVLIMPKAEAKINDNGHGRREPNHSPVLPPPTGRLKWSWNPFVLGSQLCGPKLCFYFTCCLVTTAVILLMIFCQPAMNLVISVCVKLFV